MEVDVKLTAEQIKLIRAENALAHEIAEEYSASLIECHGVNIRDKAGCLRWYEIDPNEEYAGPYIQRALRYLKMRGLLRVNPRNPNQVKVRWK